MHACLSLSIFIHKTLQQNYIKRQNSPFSIQKYNHATLSGFELRPRLAPPVAGISRNRDLALRRGGRPRRRTPQEAGRPEEVQGDAPPSLPRRAAEELQQVGVRAPGAAPPEAGVAGDLPHAGDGGAGPRRRRAGTQGTLRPPQLRRLGVAAAGPLVPRREGSQGGGGGRGRGVPASGSRVGGVATECGYGERRRRRRRYGGALGDVRRRRRAGGGGGAGGGGSDVTAAVFRVEVQ